MKDCVCQCHLLGVHSGGRCSLCVVFIIFSKNILLAAVEDGMLNLMDAYVSLLKEPKNLGPVLDRSLYQLNMDLRVTVPKKFGIGGIQCRVYL